MLSFTLLTALLGIASASPLGFHPGAHRTDLAPLILPGPPPSSAIGVASTGSHIIPDSYIVTLKKELSADHHESHLSWVKSAHAHDVNVRHAVNAGKAAFSHVLVDLGGLVHNYNIGNTVRGYTGRFSLSMLEQIRMRPEVAYVEHDSLVWTNEIEKGAPWGLSRTSHRKTLGFGTFNKYEFDEHAGQGVTAYIIDTGVNIDHVELEGRAKWGKTIPLNDQDVDANGHGSHVAGTVGSRAYGIAKKVSIVAVKVLGSNGSGSMSDVVGGVAWAADHAAALDAAAAKNSSSTHKGSVANMSLGGGKSISLDEAVNAAVESGLHFAVAAGNDNRDACTFSPAAAEGPITVAASTIGDARAYFSNHGKCVDIVAPGLNIKSIWNTGKESTNSISGTSMASPHVAGLAAYFLSLYPTTFVPTAADYITAGETDPAYLQSEIEVSSYDFITRPGQMIFGKLREWTGFAPSKQKPLPPPAPKHPKTILPKVLKQAMIRVATSGILTDLPASTPNKLIFNNFTTSG